MEHGKLYSGVQKQKRRRCFYEVIYAKRRESNYNKHAAQLCFGMQFVGKNTLCCLRIGAKIDCPRALSYIRGHIQFMKEVRFLLFHKANN